MASGKVIVPATMPQKKKKSTIPSHLQLSPCAWKYAKVLLDPFNEAAGACLPSFPSIPSKKIKAFSVGTMTSNTASGVGYVVINPGKGVSNTGAWGIATTVTTFSATTIQTSSASAGCLAFASNSPLSSTTFGSQSGSAKLVSCGIRIRYIGPLLYQSGTVNCILSQNHGDLNNQPLTNVQSWPNTNRVPVGREWVNVTFRPQDPSDYDVYLPGSSTTAINDGTGTTACLALVIAGCSTTNPCTFEYEAYGHYEAFGTNVPDVTPGESDPFGAAAVQNILSSMTK